MEQQSTSATPSKRQDYVQYNPQLVINYNQQYSHNQEQGLASPSQEHAEDSMLELKDVDTVPSNYSFVSHQIPNNNMYPMMPPQQPMMVQPQQVIYLPAETHQRVYETPSNNNYIHPVMIMNPNVPASGNNHLPTSPEASLDMNKYTTWTRVVMIFAIILGIYGCFALISQLLMIFSYATISNSVSSVGRSVPSIVLSVALSVLEIAAGAVGVWSTVTKNIKHRKYTTITHLVLLSLVVIINIAYGIIGNLQILMEPSINSYNASGSSWTLLFVFSILFYILLVFACCGSCIGCQAYRFRIFSKIQEQPETAQGEGFMVMRDEA